MKKLTALLLALVMTVSLAACSGTAPEDGDTAGFTVGVIQYMSHPSLDNCYNGIAEALTEAFGDGVVIDHQIGSDASADADAAAYAAQFAAKDYDMIIAIATPAAKSAFAAAEEKDIPVVFCAVSDPVAPGLVNSLEEPGYNCSGTSDVLDMEAQISLIRSLLPEVSTVGVLYTSSEDNSLAQLKLLTEAAESAGITVEATGVQNASDIPAAASALCAKVDCINNFTDNNIVNNLPVLLDAANDAGIPVFGSEEEQVKNGCLASASIDYVALGRVTGEMAAEALSGASLAAMPVRTISEATPVINEDVLAAFGLPMPEAFADATIVTTNR